MPARFGRNLVSLYLNTAMSALIAIVMTPVLAHGLGKEQFGIWVVVGSMILYLELLEFGFGSATVKYVAEYKALGDWQRVRRTIATSFWVLSIPGLIALAVGIVLTILFPTLFDVPAGAISSARILVLLLAVDMAISIPGDTLGGTLIGLQRYDLLNLSLIVVALAQAIGWAIIIATDGGLVMLAVVTVALSLAGQLWRYLMVRRLVPDVSISPKLFDRSLVKPVAGLSMWFALIDLSMTVVLKIDVIIVGAILGLPAAAVYGVGQKLALVAEKVTTPATSSFFPFSSELSATKGVVGIRDSLVTATRISLGVAGPLCLTLILLAKPAVTTWLGPSFVRAGQVVALLGAAAAIKALTRPGLIMLNGAGKARVAAFTSTFEAVINLTLSVILARSMGLVGVALATLIASIAADLLLFLPLMCRQLEVSLISFLLPVARAHVLPIAVALGVGFLLPRSTIDGLPSLLLCGAAIGISYLLTFLVTGLSRDERNRARSLLRRRAAASPGSP
jgi:O-antigen/teichoic acid export membrane protein